MRHTKALSHHSKVVVHRKAGSIRNVDMAKDGKVEMNGYFGHDQCKSN